MIRAGIAGATGYTGAELVKLITGHPDAQLTAIASRSYAGTPISEIFPAMRGVVDLACEPMDMDALSQKVDVIFLALPHKVSMSHTRGFLDRGVKVIDLSADFRFKDAATYEAAYQEHVAKDLLERAVYGLCELYRDKVAATDLVGNPGCYPTSFLLPTVPLIRAGLIEKEGIISDSKSGVSGAGRSLSLTTHFCEVNENFNPYKVGNHRHVPEMEAILGEAAGQEVSITFVPHLLPLTRGMLTTIYARGTEKATTETIRATLETAYSNEGFVRLLPEGSFPNVSHVRGTNFCDIGFWYEETSRRLVMVSAIDNLLKGAAGQAVQNMNILFGLKENVGLELVQGAL